MRKNLTNLKFTRSNAFQVRLASLLVLPFFLGACAAYGPAFTGATAPSPDRGAIYIYRPTAFAAGGTTQPILIDGVQVAVMKNGGYLRRELEPGHHTVEVQGFQPAGVDVTIDPGKTLFFRYTIESQGGQHIYGSLLFNYNWKRSLDNIPPDIALIELKETKALD
jgi:hypothetical protein